MIRGLVVLLLMLRPVAASELATQFASPPARYAPSCVWWWFGGAYTKRDIRTGLDAIRGAGMGGFRIVPVYPLVEDDPVRDIHNARYLSQDFLNLVKEAVRYGRQIGLTPESALGSGWPYGGPYIPVELAAGQLKFYSQEIEGPGEFFGPVPGEIAPPERLLAVQAVPVSGQEGVLLDKMIDLTSRVHNGKVTSWEIPPGRWVVMSFVGGYTGMKVKRASPGGEGLVLDHFRREALDLHLRNAGDVQAPYLRGAQTVTMDSLEVFGANWTPELPNEFKRRRGYSLIPYLAALFMPAGEQGARVRYDFRRTLSELSLENFFTPLRDWAHLHGFQTRVQAHGTPADILEAYGLSDYPEGESYGEQDKRALLIRDRRLASSAAHLFGRNEISSETFTWLRYPLFLVTLEQMKAAADAAYLDGINHVNYHGVPLSPSWAESPGWFYYASTHVSPGNTWWPYLPTLSNYLRRTNFLLQQGEPVADIAVYLPYEDVWSNAFGPWYDLAGALDQRFQQDGTAGMLAAVQNGGISFDFINAPRLAAARIDGERLRVGTMRYRAVVLPAIEAIEPEVLERLRDFCRAGGLVIATDRTPSRSAGLRNAPADTRRVKSMALEIFGDGSTPWRGEKRATGKQCGLGEGVVIGRDVAAALAPGEHLLPRVLARVIPPDALLDPADRDMGFVHRRAGDVDIYFVANISAHPKKVRARFRVNGAYPMSFDAESGSVEPFFAFHSGERYTEVELQVGPWGSVFVVFRPGQRPSVSATNVDRLVSLSPDGVNAQAEARQNGEFFLRTSETTLRKTVSSLPAPFSIPGPWRLTGARFPVRLLETLSSWEKFPEFSSFSGTASYLTEFSLPSEYVGRGTRLELEMGQVYDIAEVLVNGVSAGVAWKTPYTVSVTSAVGGPNRLEIRVTNRLFNRGLLARPLPPPYPDLRDRLPHPIASGLLGPVRLRPVQQVELTTNP